MDYFVADFETLQGIPTRVWAWATANVFTEEVIYGNTIESFIEKLSKMHSCKMFFHNLKFDGRFIIDYLLKNGWKQELEKPSPQGNKCFTVSINKGQWYLIKLCFSDSHPKQKTITIQDSMKLLPFSVEDVAKSFHLPILKGSIDYGAFREVGHELTEEEKAYIKNDVLIVAKALRFFLSLGFDKLTIGANALSFYKNECLNTKNTFNCLYPKPPIDVDKFIRRSYRGGWCIVNPLFAEKDIDEGLVFDVNSLFPSRMYYEKLPVGDPVYYKGKYPENDTFDLYVQEFRCAFELKPDHLPTIQIHDDIYFNGNEYVKDSKGREVTLVLTNVDLALFLEHYDVYNLEYIQGFMFRSAKGFFKKYIDYWIEQKIKAKKEGNYGMYIIAKLFLNSLYGKFATSPTTEKKIPYLHDGIVKYKTVVNDDKELVYIPVGTFITAYARNVTIRAAQKLYSRFLYADTDSLHIKGTELPTDLDIDDYRLGAWKLENKFKRGRYLHAKCYLEELYDENGNTYLKPTVAGMQKRQHSQVNFDNFYYGAVYDGKLLPKTVEGGVVLEDTTFEILETNKYSSRYR